VHYAQNDEGDTTQTGRQTVYAVYQVDGVRYIYYYQYGKRYADYCGYLANTEKPGE
jgi:hypothetical protein